MLTAPNEIATLSEKWVDAAADVLTDAFIDYPMTRYLFDSRGERYRAELRASFRMDCVFRVALGWPFLGALDDGRLVGVALGIGLRPLPDDSPLLEMERTMVESFAGQTASRLAEYSALKQQLSPRSPHLYLESIGVLAGHRGSGHAGRLLRELHRISEATLGSTGVGLDTQLPSNLAIYRHLGYVITAEGALGDIPTWMLFRPNEGRIARSAPPQVEP
jgi:ribosomal protein S18 acetylase RimI-like enzyme